MKKVPEYSLTNYKDIAEKRAKELFDQAQEVEHEFEIAFDTSKPFGERFMAFMRGENKAGRYTGRILDFISVFLPKGYSTARQAAQGILNINQTNSLMLEKILSLKNFLNVRDENGNLSGQEILASVIQVGIAFGIAWGAVQLGIWEQLSELLGL